MLCNYHTHTTRCHHAVGEDREYIENAIKTGIKVLGFSEHPPYIFGDGYNSFYRMDFDEVENYCKAVLNYKKEYSSDIEIHLGFELEYYESMHEREMSFLKGFNPEYFILGQHYIFEERNGYYSQGLSNEILFKQYINETIKGIETGDFIYLAHPDLPGFSVSPSVYNKEYTRLLEVAKRYDMPIELNCYGMINNRCYPDRKLFELAEKVGNKVIIGIDAHNPNNICKQTYDNAHNLIKGLNLNLIENLDI